MRVSKQIVRLIAIGAVATGLSFSLVTPAAAVPANSGRTDHTQSEPKPHNSSEESRAACTVTNISSDIVYVYTSPSTQGFAWGFLWPGPGSGSSAPCWKGTFDGEFGTFYSQCQGGSYYVKVDFFGSLGYVPKSCTKIS